MIISSYRQFEHGQAMVEFAVILPALILLLMVTFGMGVMMYTGVNASTSLKTMVENRLAIADIPNPDLIQLANGYNSGSFIVPGNNLDNLNVVGPLSNVTTVVGADKTIAFTELPVLSNLPIPITTSFEFRTAIGLDSALLETNTGSTVGLTTLPYSPGAARNALNVNPNSYNIQNNIPAFVPLDNNCVPDLSVFSKESGSQVIFEPTCSVTLGCPFQAVNSFVGELMNRQSAIAQLCGPLGSGNDVAFQDNESY